MRFFLFFRRLSPSAVGASIAARLYLVVGVMGMLIVLELAVLRFAMTNLSAVRALVGGESLWSKGQKDALFSLQRYFGTHDEKDFQDFHRALAIPYGYQKARIEVFKPQLDMAKTQAYLLEGKIHQDDTVPLILLLRRFYWERHLRSALEAWQQAERGLAKLVQTGDEYHEAVQNHDALHAVAVMENLKVLNAELTRLEQNFSTTLGDGSRYLENVVLSLLTAAVLMVEAVGLTFAIALARSLSKGLRSLKTAAQEIGAGNFRPKGLPHSRDEIGQLADSVQAMGALLERSYENLEGKVRERTKEQARLAGENAHLFQEANLSLQRRDEFLSVASHELKTPVTSMLLQVQMAMRAKNQSPEDFQKLAVFLQRQLRRINELVDDMLDTSRTDLSKLSLHLGRHDLSNLVEETCSRLRPLFAQAGTPLFLQIEAEILGEFDSYRVEQVLTNLLTNALKYAPGQAVTVSLGSARGLARLVVLDGGPGVAREDLERIFGRFERALQPGHINGLGIGLYIARAIMKEHGGNLFVENHPSGGAAFVAELPLRNLALETERRTDERNAAPPISYPEISL